MVTEPGSCQRAHAQQMSELGDAYRPPIRSWITDILGKKMVGGSAGRSGRPSPPTRRAPSARASLPSHQVFCGRSAEPDGGPRNQMAEVLFVSDVMLLLQPPANDYALDEGQLQLLGMLRDQHPDGPWDELLRSSEVRSGTDPPPAPSADPLRWPYPVRPPPAGQPLAFI